MSSPSDPSFFLGAPGQPPVLAFACCVGSLRFVGCCSLCSCWCRFRVRGAQSLVYRDCAGGGGCRLCAPPPPPTPPRPLDLSACAHPPPVITYVQAPPPAVASSLHLHVPSLAAFPLGPLPSLNCTTWHAAVDAGQTAPVSGAQGKRVFRHFSFRFPSFQDNIWRSSADDSAQALSSAPPPSPPPQTQHGLGVCIWMHLVIGTGNSPSLGQPTLSSTFPGACRRCPCSARRSPVPFSACPHMKRRVLGHEGKPRKGTERAPSRNQLSVQTRGNKMSTLRVISMEAGRSCCHCSLQLWPNLQ